MKYLPTNLIAATVLLAGLIAMPMASAAPGGNGNGNAFGLNGGNGNGNAFGLNGGNGNGNNGNGNGNGGNANGAPLPALGATLIGHAVGAGGLYMAWRRRRKAAKSK